MRNMIGISSPFYPDRLPPLGGRTDPPDEGECYHPSVVMRDIVSRPRPKGHVIVFANVKGGVGKSTLALHCCVALCNAGSRVIAVDLDLYQHSFASALTYREATARVLKVALPQPRHVLLEKQSGALLSQEIARLGPDSDFVIIDVAGHDSSIARYAIAMADTLVTPINNSFVDLSVLSRFDPITMQPREPSRFARLIADLNMERARYKLRVPDWVVVKNRIRTMEITQDRRIDGVLASLASQLGFRIGDGLSERVAYRELFLYGLTHLDLDAIPAIGKRQSNTQELQRYISTLNLPAVHVSPASRKSRRPLLVPPEASEDYRRAIEAGLSSGVYAK